MATVAFVTYGELPELSAEDRRVCDHLRDCCITPQAVVWNDPTVDWASFDCIVVRSVWDYYHQPEAFGAWLDRIEQLGVPMWNPVGLVRWNMDKHYLLDLARRGVQIIPTVCVEQGQAARLAEILESQGWNAAVVKPTISAAAFATWRTTLQQAERDQAQFAALLAQTSVLIQPFVEQVATEGEWSLVFIGGRYSHAVLKRPRQDDFRVQEMWGGVTIPVSALPGLVAQASAILATIDQPWLFARVDGVVVDGTLRLMELEMIEPALFMARAPQASANLAQAIQERMTRQATEVV